VSLLSLYGLFLAKVVTIAVVIGALAILIVGLRQRKSSKGELHIVSLGEQYRDMQRELRTARLDPAELKSLEKDEKKQEKAKAKLKKQQLKQGQTSVKPCVYVIDFKGSMDAHEVVSLREEISAVLSVANAQDELLVRLESPGGVVHGYGLAASQLTRVRDAGIKLTVAVDKVAASGGYMMACVADNIVAAPFAIIGSIGVVAQIPNFHRLLKKNDIDVELHTAGQFKRTLTLLGENTQEGREKFREELNETHDLFKQFVKQYRPQLDMDSVATGEHWFGQQAQEKGLIDSVGTSDDLLIAKIAEHDVYSVSFSRRKRFVERFTGSAAESVDGLLMRWWQRSQRSNY
jgi:serine protease SohB